MINVIVENPECIPEYVDSSINAKNTYYLLCSNLEKIYWTVNDMQNNQVKGFAKHLDDSKAILYCESLISEE